MKDMFRSGIKLKDTLTFINNIIRNEEAVILVTLLDCFHGSCTNIYPFPTTVLYLRLLSNLQRAMSAHAIDTNEVMTSQIHLINATILCRCQ